MKDASAGAVSAIGNPSATTALSCDMLRIQHRLFLALNRVRDLPQTLRLCLDAVLEVAGMECGTIYLTEASGGLRLAHEQGLSPAFIETVGWYAPAADCTRQVMNGALVYGRPSDGDAAVAEREHQEGLRVFVTIPVRYKERVIGCAMATSRQVETMPPDRELALDTMASLIGLLISEAQSDEALRISEARYEATFEQAAVGIAQVAPDGRWLRVNHKLCEIVGYSREELLTMDFQALTPADTLEADLESVRQLLAHEVDSYSKEKRYIRKDGSSVWINLTVSLNRRPDGEPDYIVAVIEDIQARKQVEEVLRRFSRVVEQTASAVIVTDTHGVIQYVNPGFTKTSGYTETEVIGRPAGVLKSGHTAVTEYDRLWRTISGGEVWKGEFRNRRKGGALYWASAIISPVRDEQGHITNYVGIQEDITERKQSEAALKESESILRKAQRMARIGNWKRDPETGHAIWSDEIYRIFGRDPALPAATFDEMARYFTPESWRRLWAGIEKALHEGIPYDVDAEIVRTDGSSRWVHSHGEVVRDDNGAIVELTGMVQDVTERKVAEQTQLRFARALKLLSQCRRALVHAENEQQLLNEICRLTVETGGYLMAWVGFAEQGETKHVRAVAQSGYEEGYLDNINVTWDDTERGHGPTGTAIRMGVAVVTQDCLTHPRMKPWREAAIKRGYQSSIALPLKVNRQVAGAITIYSAEPFAFADDEVSLLEELAADLAYGVETLRTRAERQWAEAVLAVREAQYRAVIDTTTDGFWMLGAQGRLLAVNDAYIRRSGYSREELLAMRVSDLEVRESSDEVRAHIEQVRRTGSDLFETQHRTKSGEVWPVEINAAYWPEAGGRIFAFVRDISQRKQLEQQIIDVSTAEQERIGREIHDGIGQQLTAVGMLANSLERKLTQAQRLQEAKAAGELVHHLQQVLTETKTLARGLSPVQIGPDGLVDALSLLVDGAQGWSGVQCRLSIVGKIGTVDELAALHLYRIAQEAINNAIKHAKAGTIEVLLNDTGENISLAIYDNGIGIDPGAEKTGGLGVHIMRYRAGIIGATLTIAPVADGGTLVECIWYRVS